MLEINNVLRLNEPPWQRIDVDYLAAGGTAIAVSPGTILWTPPAMGYVRGLIAWGDSVNPLVGASLSIGVETQPVDFVSSQTVATYNTVIQGQGINGTSTSAASNGCGDAGVAMGPAGAFRGQAALVRTIRGFASVATITGLLHISFEFRRIANF